MKTLLALIGAGLLILAFSFHGTVDDAYVRGQEAKTAQWHKAYQAALDGETVQLDGYVVTRLSRQITAVRRQADEK